MSVEHANRSWVRRQAPVLLGFLLAAGACTRRERDTRAVVGAGGAAGDALAGSSVVPVAPHLAPGTRERAARTEAPSLRPPLSGPGSSGEARSPGSLAHGAKLMRLESTRQGDELYALVDDDGDHQVDRVHAVPRGLDSLDWLTYRGGASSSAELGRLLGIDALELRPDRSAKRVVVITDKLPARQRHGWRYVRFGSGGWLYIPVRISHQA